MTRIRRHRVLRLDCYRGHNILFGNMCCLLGNTQERGVPDPGTFRRQPFTVPVSSTCPGTLLRPGRPSPAAEQLRGALNGRKFRQHRHRGGVSGRHAGVRLVGQVPHQEQQRLPRRRPPPRPVPLHRHHGRRRARRRLDRRRRRPGLQVRHLRHVARGRDRRRRAAAQPALRQHHPETEDLHRLPDADPALRQQRHADLRHRDAGLHADALRHLHRRLRHHLRGALRLGPRPRDRHRRRDRPGLLDDRRHVVHHAGRPGPVRHQDGRHLLPDAAVHAQRRRRLRRASAPAWTPASSRSTASASRRSSRTSSSTPSAC